MRLTRAFSAALAAALFAAGCGGGGGGGGGGNGGDPPIADAGDDAEARLYQAHVLDGSQSVDPEGKDLTHTWTVLSAPDGAALALTSDGAAAQVSFTPDREGLYAFGLVVSDGKKQSTLDVVEVNVVLRIAVFADRHGYLAADFETLGLGRADDFVSEPNTFIGGTAGTTLLIVDESLREPQLLAYDTFANQLQFVASHPLDVEAQGEFVAWTETRNGRTDIFARNVVTGVEVQVTNDDLVESLDSVTNGIVVWEFLNPPYSTDVAMADLATGSTLGLSTMDIDVGEYDPRTDGETVVYTQQGSGSADVLAYDIVSQTPIAIATSTTAEEYALGVSGDFVILSISTASTPTVYRHRISSSERLAIAVSSSAQVEGDWVLADDAGILVAHRLSTGVTTQVTPAPYGDGVVLNGTAVWTEFNATTSSMDVYTRLLPSGAITAITATPEDESAVYMLEGGIAWVAFDDEGISQAWFKTTLAATPAIAIELEKPILRDQLADYDVAIVGSDVEGLYARNTIDAMTAAGVPFLSAERDGNSAGSYFVDEARYGLILDGEDCGPNQIRFAGFAHPAYEGFPVGGVETLEIDVTPFYSYASTMMDTSEAVTDWTELATFAFPSTCPIADEPAIVAFTTSDGSAVILDGTLTDDPFLWQPARRHLLFSELRYLASTRAP